MHAQPVDSGAVIHGAKRAVFIARRHALLIVVISSNLAVRQKYSWYIDLYELRQVWSLIS